MDGASAIVYIRPSILNIALGVCFYITRKFILCYIGRAAGFQVTDEFIAQLPQQLIIPNSHLQISKSIGQG